MTAREVNALPILFFIWKVYGLINNRNAEKTPKPCLVITAPNADKSFYDRVNRLFSVYELDDLFCQVKVVSLSISQKDDIYVRDAKDHNDTLPRLGLKSGPNTQFFHTMRVCSNFHYTLLNEVDMLPLRADWLQAVANVIPIYNNFFVVGSRYSGHAKLGPDIARHINGNAIYNTGNRAFQEFLDSRWEPGVEKMCKDQPDTAYDIWFSRHYYECMFSGFQDLSSNDYQYLQECDQRFISTQAIADLLPTDLPWFDHLSDHINNGVILLHGKNAPATCLQLAFAELERDKGCIAAKTIYKSPMSSRLFLSLKHAHSDSRITYQLKRHFRKAQSEAPFSSTTLNRITLIMEAQQHSKVITDFLESDDYARLPIPLIKDLKSDDDSTASTLFAFAPYKSGSTLLFTGLELLSRTNHINMRYKSYYDESFKLYGDTSSWLCRISPEDLFNASGYIYGGFRDAYPFTSRNQEQLKIDIVAKSKALSGGAKFIFLLRDPRDCLVSLYYSHLKSHRISTSSSLMNAARTHAETTPIDRYVIHSLASTYQNIAQMLSLLETIRRSSIPYQVFVYEDIFNEQHSMFREICSSLNYDLDDKRWKQLVDESQVSNNPLNVHPTSEDQARHIRKGTPGDYKAKLGESTIRLINKPLQPLLELLQRINPNYNYME